MTRSADARSPPRTPPSSSSWTPAAPGAGGGGAPRDGGGGGGAPGAAEAARVPAVLDDRPRRGAGARRVHRRPRGRLATALRGGRRARAAAGAERVHEAPQGAARRSRRGARAGRARPLRVLPVNRTTARPGLDLETRRRGPG